jgi:hypothetical protein
MSSRIPESFLFQEKIALLPNDGVLPTASFFIESFEENFLLNYASLPNSAHKSVPFLYQFLVLTAGQQVETEPRKMRLQSAAWHVDGIHRFPAGL